MIQGYGLTETAPIVTLNHPFHASPGSVGKPVAGVKVRIAEDGEILVRGENVSKGYYGKADSGQVQDGWLHTGDIGSLDEKGRLHVRGRKKEMIVTPEGLNVFPEDIERVLNRQPGVRDSAIIGDHRPHAVLVLDPGTDPETVVRQANAQLEPHQQIRQWTIWPENSLPRTEGTSKLKHREIQTKIAEGVANGSAGSQPRSLPDDLGLSSLERVELQVKLEQRPATAKPSTELSDRVDSVPGMEPVIGPPCAPETRASFFLLPLARVFAHVKAIGREHLSNVHGPVLFAANHQSHLDLPAILMALPSRFRYRLATAMSREFFHAYLHPEGQPLRKRFRFGLEYFLACLCFNAFPLPQREAGARESLQYMGELATEGWSLLIFPEGAITESGEIRAFQPGVGLIAVKTQVPVVPAHRLVGLDKVLHRSAHSPAPGPVEVRFGPPMTFKDEDYVTIAKRLEEVVRSL